MPERGIRVECPHCGGGLPWNPPVRPVSGHDPGALLALLHAECHEEVEAAARNGVEWVPHQIDDLEYAQDTLMALSAAGWALVRHNKEDKR